MPAMPLRFFLAIALSCLVAAPHAHAGKRTPSANAATDPDVDFDGDGLTNAQEAARHTNPKEADTDGDGVPDAGDAVGYDSFFTFTAAPEATYAVIDLGPISAGTIQAINNLSVNNLGTVVLAMTGAQEFKLIRPGYDPITITGTFADLNNAGTVLYKTSAKVLKTRLADGTVQTHDYSSIADSLFGVSNVEISPHGGSGFNAYLVDADVNPAGLWDSGDVLVWVGAILRVVYGSEYYGDAEAEQPWVDHSGDRRFSERVLLKNTEQVSGTAYTDADYDLGGMWGEARIISMDELLNYYRIPWSWDWHRERQFLGSEQEWVEHVYDFDLSWDYAGPNSWNFSDGVTVVEPDGTRWAYTLQTAARLPGQQGLWKSWVDENYVPSLSLEGPNEGKSVRNGKNGAWLRSSAIAANGLMLSGGYYTRLDDIYMVHNDLWRNGRVVSLAELAGADSTWSGLSIGYMSDNGQFLAGSAKHADGTRHSVLLVPAALQVDSNRDGQIDSLDPAPTADKPFRFWVNDDIDREHIFKDSAGDTMDDIFEKEEDDIGPEEAGYMNWQPDYIDGRIESKRDLEDFARLWIHTQGLNDAFRNGDLRLGLKWTDTDGTTPSIQIYHSVEQDGGLGYLTDEEIAASQLLHKRNAISLIDVATGQGATRISGSGTFVLPASLFGGLSEAQPNTFLLFEGCTPGKGQLRLVILKLGSGATYTEIGDAPGVWLDLKKIGDMYEHWSVGNASGGPPNSIATRIPSLTGSGTAFRYDNPDPSPEERQYILYVHGWNMEQWEKERFAETAYKRLWWQGYKGRFGLFTWPCTNGFDETSTLGKVIEGIADGTHFDRGEWSAWRSGAPLRQLLQALSGAYSGQLYVFSHSMGGIVMSEALRLQSDAGGRQIVNVYVASQTALSAHLYDGTLSTAAGSASSVQWTYDHPSFAFWIINPGPKNYGPKTANVYRNWLAYLLNGGAVSSKAVGTLVNFYNQNDWALAAPVWQFNQITKPDWPDLLHSQPWTYDYVGDPAYFADVFVKKGFNVIYDLHLGTRSDPKDRYEIMAFAAESYVKAFGAMPNVAQGVTRSFDVRSIWPSDGGDHKAHIWHSGQFRSNMPKQKDYWKALLGQPGFQIPTPVLP